MTASASAGVSGWGAVPDAKATAGTVSASTPTGASAAAAAGSGGWGAAAPAEKGGADEKRGRRRGGDEAAKRAAAADDDRIVDMQEIPDVIEAAQDDITTKVRILSTGQPIPNPATAEPNRPGY
jgi:hypothetical protein